MSQKSKNSWKTKPRLAKTGYGLHIARFAYAGKEGMRSFKIPLKNKNQTVFDEFVGKIKNDYINQVGLLNLSDWYEYDQKQEEHYSLADFWLDSLRAGVIFAHKEIEIKNLIVKIRGEETLSEKFDKTVKRKYPDLYRKIRINVLYDFFTSAKRPGDKSFEIFCESIASSLLKDRKEKDREITILAKKLAEMQFTDERRVSLSQEAIKFVGFDLVPNFEYDHTFFLHPDLVFNEQKTPKELLSDYRRFLQERPELYKGENITERLKMIFGFFNNHGAFSRYFNATLKAFRESDPSLSEQIISVSPYWQTHKKELEERIVFLQRQSQKIKDTELAKPHEYISSFGGKFESWVSNSLRQETEIKEQLFGFDEVNKKDELTGKFVEGNEQELNRIITKKDEAISVESVELAGKCLQSLEKLKNNINDAELSLYGQLIGELRIKLNVEFQNAYPELRGKTETEKNKDAKNKRADKRYPKIFKDVKLVPNFLGETKRVVYKKFIRSADIIHEGVNFIDYIDKQIPQKLSHRFKGNEALTEFTEQQFETLRRKYYLMNSPRFHHVISKIITSRKLVELRKKEDDEWKTFADRSFAMSGLFLKEGKIYKNEKYYAFYVNPKARDQGRTKVVLDIDENNAVEILRDFVTELKPKWDDIIKGNDAGELIDAIEIEKVRLGILTALYHEHKFKIRVESLSPDLFESAHQYLRLEDNPRELSGAVLGRLLQSLVCAEIKGAINKISRTEYVERFIAQPMKSEESYPLAVIKDQDSKITWHLVSRQFLNKQTGTAVKIKIGKDFSGLANSYKEYFVTPKGIFDLVSSKYHLQFLTKTLGGGDFWWKRKNISVSVGSHSFIFEQTVRLRWSVKDKTLEVVRGQEKRDRNLYLSIPFIIKPQKTKTDLTKRNRYMGIDVGEYGLAWTIIDVDTKNKKVGKILKQGFIYEPLTHKVRNYVATLKDNQVRGTFGMPDTKLTRLRENAITSLRNRVHDIAIRYDAKPVYEFEISNFETGSNKVKVIYDSVKRADTGRGGNEAEKEEANLVWGKKGKNFGASIGAYATSYICSACGNSPYLDFEDSKLEDYKRAKDKLNRVRKLSRPSLGDFLAQNPKYKNDKRLQEVGGKDGEWKTRRGNSAIYVCQNPKCKNISDADVQASYWIALKRATRDLYKDKETGEGLLQEKGKKKENELVRLIDIHNKNRSAVTGLNLNAC